MTRGPGRIPVVEDPMTRRADDAEASGVDVPEPAGVALLSRTAILAAEDIQYELVEVPEWGGTVRVRSLTGTERDQYDAESWSMTHGGKDAQAALTDFRVRRVARAIVDEDGASMFGAADIAALGRKNGAVIDRLDDVVTRLSGMDDKAVKAALEALKDAPSGGSGTA
jgi:hypothetical protein